MKFIIKIFSVAFVMIGVSCSNHSTGPHDTVNGAILQIYNVPNEFDAAFSGKLYPQVADRPLNFGANNKVKIAIISANSNTSGSLIIQLYKSDNSMPFKKSYSLNGNFTMDEIVALDFTPARIILDFPEYSATGFQFQIQAVQ